MKYLSLCMIALLTFTSVSFASVSAVNGEESTETTSHGGVCMDERSAAHDSIQPLRDEMKQNWETFREAYGSIQQYFE